MTGQPETLARPARDGRWLRPVATGSAEARWGHPDGLQVGLAPLPGPRGLLRLYAPYLEHDRLRLVNFIAVEPIPAGATERGFSELEHSDLDDVAGKRFWSSDSPGDELPRPVDRPARGVVEVIDGIEHLTVWVQVERFANGAAVDVRLRFREDRPREVALAGVRRESSVELDACVLTATMGNWARLRRLHLRDRVVHPRDLWPGFEATHFTEHATFELDELSRVGEAAVVAATPDETDPLAATYAPGTKEHWHYVGRPAVQGWRIPQPHPDLRVLVNGRWAYWASESPIPGGVSYENFEVFEPFRDGAEYVFWIEPLRSDDGIATLLKR